MMKTKATVEFPVAKFTVTDVLEFDHAESAAYVVTSEQPDDPMWVDYDEVSINVVKD